MTYLDPGQEAEVDSVVGAYMQIRREAMQAVGLLDESFFMYGEDLDWAFRIKQAGWTIVYHPQVMVKHVKRAASRQSQRAQLEFYRAMLIFYRKHYRETTPSVAAQPDSDGSTAEGRPERCRRRASPGPARQLALAARRSRSAQDAANGAALCQRRLHAGAGVRAWVLGAPTLPLFSDAR